MSRTFLFYSPYKTDFKQKMLKLAQKQRLNTQFNNYSIIECETRAKLQVIPDVLVLKNAEFAAL